MINKLRYQSGFSVIEALLILVIVGMLGFTGWYVWHAKQNAYNILSADNSSTPNINKKNSTSNSSVSNSDQYTGWKTYSSDKEGLSFKYPSDWSAKDDPCVNPDTQVAGQCYQIISPKRSNSPYIFEITYYWNQQKQSAIKDGETVKLFKPLNVSNTKNTLSLVGYSINQISPDKIAQLDVTDQKYSLGKTVDYIPNVKSQKQSRMEYTFAAVMKTPSQQFIPGFTLAQYQAQPDYNTILKIFESLNYQIS